jgi:hypothetical protein
MTVASRAFLPEFNPHRVRNAAPREPRIFRAVRSDSYYAVFTVVAT